MKIESKKLADLTRCYATSPLTVHGRLKYLFASELDDACYAFDAETGERTTVWAHPGGTMAIIPLKGTDGEFLAVQNFKPKMLAPNTMIVWAKPKDDGGWDVTPILHQGYIHRFDVLRGDKNYIMLCTIATHKDNYEDWSHPGKLWAGVLPDDLTQPIEIHPIRENLTRNHGYCRVDRNGKDAALIASDEGVFEVTPPQVAGDDWRIEPVLSRPVSDIAVVDIDGDGEEELAAIEPLHGNTFTVNKKTAHGWEIVYRYPGDFQFGHVVWGGMLRGVPTFIGGARQGAGELFVLRCAGTDPLMFSCELIDSGKGPGNVAVLNGPEQDVILTSNRESDQATLYMITD